MQYKRPRGLSNKVSEYLDSEQQFRDQEPGIFQLRQGTYRVLFLLAVILFTVILLNLANKENESEGQCSSQEEK